MRTHTRISIGVINRLVEKLRKKSGVLFSAHKPGNNFAVQVLAGVCKFFVLLKMMDHCDIKTSTIYLFAATAHLQEQMQASVGGVAARTIWRSLDIGWLQRGLASG